jgi:hypothetical protein
MTSEALALQAGNEWGVPVPQGVALGLEFSRLQREEMGDILYT